MFVTLLAACSFEQVIEKIFVVLTFLIPTVFPTEVDEMTSNYKPAVKYHGITIDLQMSFFQQIWGTVYKAATGMFAIIYKLYS